MQAQPELMRQHEAYRAVRERLFPKPKPAPALAVLRDYDAHVRAFRDWNDLRATLKAAGTSASVSVSFGPYASYSAPVVIPEEVEPVAVRRSMKEICLDVLQRFPGATLEDVKGPRRSRYIVAARHTCVYAIYAERKDISFTSLGRFFERDHTTVLHAIRNIENGKAWPNLRPPIVAVPRKELSRDELEFLRFIRDRKPLPSGVAKDRSQERPRARMRNIGFAEYSERLRRWVITPAGLEALKRAEESA
ncbi:helix-turn-helix domain-containing protein [Sinorhizobium meliloti]|uniref:helix-turn-helix domain-containing protein n=1 Tax=Rhizobium meliloti TaxID=382 RepID=UPI000FD7850F|nr:helix-turn-helix domain-containing protein [Sinorhizobium meliloti]RVG88690.1 hypothetical protein CN219_03730 [Sinorhizobium meliloti]RVI39028.1 hypothetical protein CN197_02505 [Sinorhizobium meliloti]RVI46663.1 hypothetical protein CN196_09355 [Sinorhizobium meliloti]RVJ25665.1 hypothetical protein CN177_13395 [Sinorhizobium meliloti]RVK02256.1 hypothetical protein CN170_08735 [Sinorhizobium meliloti]